MTDSPAPKPPRFLLAAFPERYAVPARPSAAPPVVQDAHRQTNFLLGNDLAVLESAMNLQLRIVAANAKVRGPQAAALFGYWSRVFSHISDAVTLMAHGSYLSCPPLLRASLDCLAAERWVIGDEFREYEDWFPLAFAQDTENRALAVETGRFRAASVLIGDDDLGKLYRLLSDLSMPHFGTTLWLSAPEASLQKIPAAFADTAFHLAWAELITGWALRLAAAQLEAAAEAPILILNRTLTADCASVQRDIWGVLGNKRRCYVEEAGGGFVFNNFRRAPTGQPKRVVLA